MPLAALANSDDSIWVNNSFVDLKMAEKRLFGVDFPTGMSMVLSVL